MSDQTDQVFNALGEPVRRRIVELLAAGPTSVGNLALALPVGRPAVSKHLKVLSDAGITEHRSVGTSNLYALRPDGAALARRWLSDAWDDVLSSYAAAATATARRRTSPTTEETP
jgi:DNA-binding transcriptional ArsR family regulator